jgi:hypothetical protein
MTPQEFLQLALKLPEATLGRHPGGADIRVGGKIFASPADRPGGTAVLGLTPEQSEMVCEAEPTIFQPVKGRGGARGWTRLIVAAADETTAQSALWMAWRNAAPPKLLAAWQDSQP